MITRVAILANAHWEVMLPLPAILLVIQHSVIEREVRYLERELGEEYLPYKEQRQRWI